MTAVGSVWDMRSVIVRSDRADRSDGSDKSDLSDKGDGAEWMDRARRCASASSTAWAMRDAL